jgi:torulene dioxygenase
MSVFEKRSDIHNVGVTVGVNLPSFKSRPTNPDVDVHGHRATNLVIATDAAVLCEMDPSTMEPISFPNHSRFHPDLKGPLGSAHAMLDLETGDYINYNLDLGKQPVYRVFRVAAASGKTDILATIPYKAAYVHSFFMTPNYVVLCLPVADYKWNGLKMLWEGNLKDSFKPFDPSEKCRWFVIDRHHGKGVVAEFASPASFFFHTVNAFEGDDGDVFCELVEFPNRYILDGLYYDVILDRNGKATEFWTDGQRAQQCFPRLVRYRLRKKDFAIRAAPAAGPPAPELVTEITSPHSGDLPVINPKYRCKKHRYTYMVVSRVLSTMLDAIIKLDTETRELLQWEGPKGHTPGEAIFVPRPAADAEMLDEDDGVLLSVVLDGANRISYLLCLDAKTMTELGRAECEFAVAIGLHGCHVPATAD